MKRCVFESLLMLSLAERKARKVQFHRRATVIRGPNDTGKSCLIKTIYRTFSPIPPKLHPNWIAAEVRSAIRFSIDGVPYTILHNEGRFSIFDATGHLAIATSNVTSMLAPFIADMFGFHLQLQSRTSEATQATPPFLFLPYYVDQDVSWHENWASFTQLRQFTRWRKDVAEYHMGVRPDEYYQAKSGLARIRVHLKSLQDRRDVLEGVLKRLREDLARINFDIDLDSYQKEIEALLVYCNRLQKKEEELKRELVRLYNAKAVAEAQVTVTTAAAREVGNDYRFATDNLPDDEVECPLCGTLHQNSFAERFAIARDAQRCQELLVELRSDISKLDAELLELKSRYVSTEAELAESKALLNQKQGEVTLRQLIESEGRKQAKAVVERDMNDVHSAIGGVDAEIRSLTEQMKQYDDRERCADIRNAYRNRMASSLRHLDVLNLSPPHYRSLDAQIPESGSDLPRALLAYYFSVLNTINNNSSATVCPIVIDSPRQQDTDAGNWLRILNFIRDNRPAESQLILSLVDDAGVDFGGDIIDLAGKRSVLTKDEFDAVATELMPLIARSEAAPA